MNQETAEAEVNAKLQQWENDTIFPKEFLPTNFLELVDEVFSNYTAFNLRMPLDFYRQLQSHTEINEFSMMEISCICHACKITNRNDMGMDKPEYLDFQDGVESIAKEFLRLSTEKKGEFEKAMQRKIEATARAERSVPEHKKTIQLPATAQA